MPPLETPLGVELPQRRLVPYAALVVAVVFVVPVVLALVSDTDQVGTGGRVGIAAVVALVFVALPALSARTLLRRHVFVSTDRISVTSGDRLVLSLPFVDLTQVKPGLDAAPLSAETFAQQGTLHGLAAAGTRAGKASRMVVSGTYVTTLEPLLAALVPEVRRRPDLLPGEPYRELFEEYAATDG